MTLPLVVTVAVRNSGAVAGKTALFVGLVKATAAATGWIVETRLTLSRKTVLSPPARSVPTKVRV